VSPAVGALDEAAFDDLLDEAPDEALGLLADLVGATDRRLAELARRLAGRVFVDLASPRSAARPGIGKVIVQRYQPEVGDLDIDASLDALVAAAATGELVDPHELRVRHWGSRSTAWCVLLDRSGSMGGEPLAAAALAAATVACRQPLDYSVVTFCDRVVVPKSQQSPKSTEAVVADVLALRGHGTTDLAGGLRAAAEQLGRSTASRKITVLLSDCRATVDGDALAAARALDELVVIAPEADADEAQEFAAATGAHLALLRSPADVPAAIGRALQQT
jgi:Mg-chelatase subunit ChlD